MLWLFSSDLSLYVLSLLEFKDIFALYLLSRDIHQFLIAHETAVFHQLAILHRFVSVGVSWEDVARAEDHRGGWLHGIQSWKELCRRCVLMERNWSGRGTVLEGAYMTFNGDVRSFEIDEVERTIIAIIEYEGKRRLSVHALEDGRELWRLAGIARVKHSNGYLLLTRDNTRNNGGLEIWLRLSHALVLNGGATPLRAPSLLALTTQQEQLLQHIDTSGDARGRYVPHGLIPSFTGASFLDCCFRHPLAATIDREDPHVAQVYDVTKGVQICRMDLDKLGRACASQDRPFQTGSALLDIDITSEYICAAFDTGILVASLHDAGAINSSSAVVPAILFEEDFGSGHPRQSALQLTKSDGTDESLAIGEIVSHDPILSISCSAKGTMEAFSMAPPSAEYIEENSQALVRNDSRRSSFFISAKFSPDGRHVIVGTALGLVYLLPNVPDLVVGLTKLNETVQKVNAGEALRDVLWEEQLHRIVMRTEPGDTFIADLNPGYHKDISVASETAVRIDTANIHRLCDFCTPYGTLFGNVHITKTGLWFVWDAAKLQDDVLVRMKVNGTTEPAAVNKNKATTVCFMNFAPPLV